ncbi:hypothetical protein [Hymenobacter sp. DG25A]|uniref:hypothetical protein n=1 Tax=Hymenobacter sp. DG25A TaxID=1385663 RepID=UPI0006BC6FC0|nr:hypothetical protein [Hymenobacter sp. DG25A]ALD21246.1 hypothetical protein AM218_08470 [Hymenobacter sp. DG25A]
MPDSSYSLLHLWPLLSRWKKPVLRALLLTLLVSTVVAFLLPNQYKSTAVFYPTAPQSTDPDQIVAEGAKLEPGGTAADLDRIITIGTSLPVAEQVVRKFNLKQHYGLGDDNTDKVHQAVLDKFSSNLSIIPSERDAIELTFIDQDKFLAAKVANTLVQIIDSINQQLTTENRRKVLALYQSRYAYLKTQYQLTRDSLVNSRKRYGVFGMDRESRYLAKEVVETETDLQRAEGEVAAGGGSAARVAGLRRALRNLTTAEGGNRINLENYLSAADDVSTLYARFLDLQERLVKARGAYEDTEVSLRNRISSIYTVQKAYPALRKSQPIRWLIVVGSVTVMLVLSVIAVSLLELTRTRVPEFSARREREYAE